MESKKIICFGEVLWDHFPDGKKLGGAPFNVTNSLKNFGADVDFISRVGDDNLGNEILKQMQNTQLTILHTFRISRSLSQSKHLPQNHSKTPNITDIRELMISDTLRSIPLNRKFIRISSVVIFVIL